VSVIDLAQELGTTDRTLRRLAEVGTIRSGRRRAGLRGALSREESYLRGHWELLSRLRAALRTEPSVMAALLFGSVAAGTDSPASDIDLVVALDGDARLRDLYQLGRRLARKVGRPVDLFNLDDLLAEPARLGPIIDEARPVVDRAHVWPRLQTLRRKLSRRQAVSGRMRRRIAPGGVSP
jgi:predicted nucleotidyltransferase